MDKSEFMQRYLKDKKEKEIKRRIDLNNCIADACIRKSKMKHFGYVTGQR